MRACLIVFIEMGFAGRRLATQQWLQR